MRRKKTDLLIIAGFLLIMAGTLTYERPFMLRTSDEISALKFIFNIMIPPVSGENMTVMKGRADRYNADLASKQKTHGFTYVDTYNDAVYDTLPGGPQNMMCVIEIPKISVLLPVGHGTSTDILSEYAGHLYGTSLPVGGESTHAVIAAHAGLPDRELFTGLPRLIPGDEFSIYVMGERHTYKVDRITEVLPSETDPLRISEGCDYVTLMTCVPYGINTHRLFVRGARSDSAELNIEDLPDMYRTRLFMLLLRIAALAILPGSEIILFYLIMNTT